MTEIHEELITLQTQLTYQEDSISQLNAVVTQQHGDIIALRHQVRLLGKRIDELASGQDLGGDMLMQERPPHY
jgi:SlyX protein